MPHTYWQDLLQRYHLGECTPAEVAAVECWYEELGQERMLPTLNPEEQLQLEQVLWARIAQQTTATDSGLKSAESVAWYRSAPLRWAAALLTGVGLAALTQLPLQWTAKPTAWVANTNTAQETAWVVHQAPAGQLTQKITLPDGSTVVLQAGSRLRYPQQFTEPQRRVYLVGEATFDVFHNPQQPFKVYTKKMVTTVLGTRFTVQAYAGQPATRVQVERGKVRVQPRATTTAVANVVVLPNQQALYTPGQEVHKELVPRPVMLAERPPELVFSDRPVVDVLTTLSKAYGVEIQYDKAMLATCTVSILLEEKSLFDNLDLLCKTLGASYSASDVHILFHSRGCRS